MLALRFGHAAMIQARCPDDVRQAGRVTGMHDWIETTGGPHLLVPEALLPLWRGVEGWSDHEDPDDFSDYARACRIGSWLGAVEIGQGSGLIFGGEVGPITWIAGSDGQGG